MMPSEVGRYFSNMGSAFTSLWDGMLVTLRHFGSKRRLNATLQYPRERWPIPERAIGFPLEDYNIIRSRLHVDIDDCIGCMQCERACPVNCIKIETIKIPKDAELASVAGSQTSTTSHDSPKRLLVTRFDIDMSECMYCNLCAYPCPEECIYMVGGPNEHKHPIDYEFAERNRNHLVYQFATATDEEVENLAQIVGIPNPRKQHEERQERERQIAAGLIVPEVAEPEAVVSPVAQAMPEKVTTEPKMDFSVLVAIQDRVIRELAKKTATAAVRSGKSSAKVAEQVKAALEEAGKLTPEIADIVARLAEAEIQQPSAARKTAPTVTPEAGPDLTPLNDISDRLTRALAKKAATGASRKGLSPGETAEAVRAALEEAGKLSDEARAAIDQLVTQEGGGSDEETPSVADDTTTTAEEKGAKAGQGEVTVDLTILNQITDRMARSKAKAILNKALRQGISPKEAAQEIRSTLTELGKLDSEAEAVLSQLESQVSRG